MLEAFKPQFKKRHLIFKFMRIITLFVCFIQCVYSETTDNIKKIYCPSKIICLKNDDLSSCSHNSKNSSLWDHITYTSQPNRIFVGEYKFYLVDAPYHASFIDVSEATQNNMIVCQYMNENYREPLGIIAIPEPNFEAYKANLTKWGINSERARCFSEYPEDCPMKEADSLAIFNNFDFSMRISVNDSSIPIYFDKGDRGYYTVRYEDIVSNCYAGNLCKLDFSTPSDGVIGSVIVDIDNAMRIKQIIYPETPIAAITQNLPFNSIKIQRTSEKEPFIGINNQINSDLLITINGKINLTLTSRKMAKIGNNLVLSACGGYQKCTINIGIQSEQPNVGAITVDARDNIKILKVVSTRSSQIIVRQIESSNSIEVNYPYLK
ncbi:MULTISPECIES: hypothetical protein [Legionella]|nr:MULTISPECIES: hypothetical protein [Legionella]MCE3045467.1 hypothetical protein [Legionella sp. 16cNR16C]